MHRIGFDVGNGMCDPFGCICDIEKSDNDVHSNNDVQHDVV